MIAPLLAFAAGVGWLQQQAELPSGWWALCGVPLLALAFGARPRLAAAAWLLLAFALGFGWAAGRAQWRLQDALPPAWEGRDIELIGVIAELPQPTDWGSRLVLQVEQVLTPQAQVPQRLLLNLQGEERGEALSASRLAVHAGERWRFTVRLKRPHGGANPQGFDAEAWLFEHNLRATGNIRARTAHRLQTMVWQPALLVERLRDDLRLKLEQALGQRPYGGTVIALAIGDQGGIPQAHWDLFARTGITHLVSISGLHVTLFAGLFAALVQALWRCAPWLLLRLAAPRAAAAAGFVGALGYALLAGFAVPAQRTVYMLAVVALALWTGRAGRPGAVLAWALAVVLLLDPWAVTAPGFWLSFGAVAFLMVSGARWLGQPHGWVSWLAAQVAVTLGSLPMLLAWFGQVSLVSPLANAWAIPWVSFVVTPLALAATVPGLHGVARAADTLLDWGLQPVVWLAGWPDATWQQHAPALWTVLLATLGMLWLVLPRGLPGRWIGLLTLLPLLLLRPARPPTGEIWLTVHDVGQGLAVLVQTSQHALLYDSGPRYSRDANAGQRVVVPALRAAGQLELDTLLISHDDSDHSGGTSAVLAAIPTQHVLTSLRPDHPLLRGVPRVACAAGQHWTWDGVRFDVLHPAPADYAGQHKDNAMSCVLRVSGRHGAALLTGDIEQREEAAVLQRLDGEPLPTSVVFASHHGSRFASGLHWVQATRPQWVVYSAGYRNRFGHPHPEVLARYSEAGAATLRTDEHGALQIRLTAAGVQVEKYREVRRRYWMWRA